MKSVTSWLIGLASVASLGWCRLGAAAEPHTEHTFQLAAGESGPAATLEDVDWLVGDWLGTAFGQKFEEVWNPPSVGSMVGLFKLIGEEGVQFYELMLLTVEDGTLSLKVKHFNADFTAWEEKTDFVEFRLVKIEPDAVHFSGLSFYKRDDGGFDGYIVFRSDSGIREEKLVYTRRTPSASNATSVSAPAADR